MSRPPRPWLGLFTAEMQGALVVTHVAEGGPAEASGVRPGDVVLRVDRHPVADLAEFYRRIWVMSNIYPTFPR